MITKIEIAALIPHPKNKWLYKDGDAAALSESIKKHKQLTPILVTDKYVILGGHRRAKVMAAEGETLIDAIIVSGLNEDEETMLLLASNEQRQKTTMEIGREIELYAEIVGRNQGARNDLKTSDAKSDGTSRKQIADRMHVSEAKVQKITKIYNEQPALLNMVDEGHMTLTQAYKQLPKVQVTKVETKLDSASDHTEVKSQTQKSTSVTEPKIFTTKCPNCGHDVVL